MTYVLLPFFILLVIDTQTMIICTWNQIMKFVITVKITKCFHNKHSPSTLFSTFSTIAFNLYFEFQHNTFTKLILPFLMFITFSFFYDAITLKKGFEKSKKKKKKSIFLFLLFSESCFLPKFKFLLSSHTG